jgi:protein-S-isoprenylcysteine O-methyltransferase Ste14
MRKRGAAVGSAIFFVVAPGVVAGLLPWLLTGWRTRPLPNGWAPVAIPLRILGAAMIIAGAGVVVSAFVRFVTEGLGTPAPVAPPTRLVVGGLYRYVRNPMYVAVLSCLIGQTLLLLQPALVWYTLVVAAAVVSFVKLYEEPHLAEQFGADYATYRRNVPGWWPRLRPWRPSPSSAGRPAD